MQADNDVFDAIIATPVGPVGVRLRGATVVEVGFPAGPAGRKAPKHPAAAEAAEQLGRYFSDPGYGFDLPMELKGTAFQQRVCPALREIPPGEVRTYGELAARLGTSPRAVGGACRANPCPILVPCHRVVAATSNGGYSGARSGRWTSIKEGLLEHEGVVWPRGAGFRPPPVPMP